MCVQLSTDDAMFFTENVIIAALYLLIHAIN